MGRICNWDCENREHLHKLCIFIYTMVLFLITVYDKHILQTFSALLFVYQCRMKISVTYLEHFESYGELNFKNLIKLNFVYKHALYFRRLSHICCYTFTQYWRLDKYDLNHSHRFPEMKIDLKVHFVEHCQNLSWSRNKSAQSDDHYSW